MKLSIIIPVYNAENDIGRCVESIKTINEIDYECIIIDDGSTDNTWLKLKKYTENIPQFIIKHITNGGVSNARNIALNLSSGDKILFLDADDYLLSDTDYQGYDYPPPGQREQPPLIKHHSHSREMKKQSCHLSGGFYIVHEADERHQCQGKQEPGIFKATRQEIGQRSEIENNPTTA